MCWLLSLPLWNKAADNTGEGKALTSLGSLYARVADYDKVSSLLVSTHLSLI
jgi:hypothetical protein